MYASEKPANLPPCMSRVPNFRPQTCSVIVQPDSFAFASLAEQWFSE